MYIIMVAGNAPEHESTAERIIRVHADNRVRDKSIDLFCDELVDIGILPHFDKSHGSTVKKLHVPDRFLLLFLERYLSLPLLESDRRLPDVCFDQVSILRDGATSHEKGDVPKDGPLRDKADRIIIRKVQFRCDPAACILRKFVKGHLVKIIIESQQLPGKQGPGCIGIDGILQPYRVEP